MEVFSSPHFDASDVKASDVKELVATLPAVGKAIRDFYRLSLSRGFAPGEGDEGGASGIPSEEVIDFLQANLNFWPGWKMPPKRCGVSRDSGCTACSRI